MRKAILLLGALCLLANLAVAQDTTKTSPVKPATTGKVATPPTHKAAAGSTSEHGKMPAVAKPEGRKAGEHKMGMGHPWTTNKSGLRWRDTIVGKGEKAAAGDTLQVLYTGWLHDAGKRGKEFDSATDKTKPFQFVLGAGSVIKGWDEGVAGMEVGGKRELFIPPDLGYGAQGSGSGTIPPNATLIFEVELLKVIKGAPAKQ